MLREVSNLVSSWFCWGRVRWVSHGAVANRGRGCNVIVARARAPEFDLCGTCYHTAVLLSCDVASCCGYTMRISDWHDVLKM